MPTGGLYLAADSSVGITLAMLDYPLYASAAALPGWRASRPLVIVLSGPSGSGKSSLIADFLAMVPDFAMSVSATTRQPRPGEAHGVAYFFLSDGEFDQLAAENGFLEHATVFGRHRYGTPRHFVEQQLASGHNVIMDVDVQGADQIRQSMPEAVRIFIAPPSAEELERRLRGRGTDDEDSIARRLAEARAEAARWADFHYVVVNDQRERAVIDLAAIIRAERCASHRCR
ncbi:MAG: guanylate kinase [Planctomycetota bacterium]|nr:MAG: guanylate kinase [Planctomycetota bacterium]